MSENSKIEWTDHTFNPWEGCQKVGPGCDHCYAESRNARFNSGQSINWGPGAPRRRTSIANWRKPLAWNAAHGKFYAEHGRRQRVFCASLADVFDNVVSVQWRYDLLRLIMDTPNLDWLLLTKRIGNAEAMLEQAMRALTVGREGWRDNGGLANVWIGATVVNQEEADRDIQKLLDVPARVRFLSIEPLLGSVRLPRFCACGCNKPLADAVSEAMNGPAALNRYQAEADIATTLGVDWVIVGGESGQQARPMHPDWARSLRDQCAAAGVPFLFKQHGEWIGVPDLRNLEGGNGPGFGAYDHCAYDAGHEAVRVGKKAADRLLDGVLHDGFPEVNP